MCQLHKKIKRTQNTDTHTHTSNTLSQRHGWKTCQIECVPPKASLPRLCWTNNEQNRQTKIKSIAIFSVMSVWPSFRWRMEKSITNRKENGALQLNLTADYFRVLEKLNERWSFARAIYRLIISQESTRNRWAVGFEHWRKITLKMRNKSMGQILLTRQIFLVVGDKSNQT